MARLIIASIIIKDHSLVLPKKIGAHNFDGSIGIEACIMMQADGNFSEYVKDSELDIDKVALDILSGKLKIQQRL